MVFSLVLSNSIPNAPKLIGTMVNMMRKLATAGLIVVKDNKLLLAFSNNKKAWYLPGGKIDAGETSVQALQREIKEELNLWI